MMHMALPASLAATGTAEQSMLVQGGKLLLHWAAQFGQAELCELLLKSNPHTDVLDERGNAPLHLAACNNHR